MAKIEFVKRVHLGGGNFEYTFKCTCNSSTNEIKVTSGNDQQARDLAQLECDEICGKKEIT